MEETFKEIDSKLSILNKETLDWIKSILMTQVSDAFDRGVFQEIRRKNDK